MSLLMDFPSKTVSSVVVLIILRLCDDRDPLFVTHFSLLLISRKHANNNSTLIFGIFYLRKRLGCATNEFNFSVVEVSSVAMT